jgi:peroxiredoxin
MSIAIGDRLPEATFTTMTSEGLTQVSTADVFSHRKVALFAVPGAFTPTCHNKHLPTFIERAEELKAKGVDTIACVAVNDIFVLDAWSKQTGAGDTITFLADGNAEFTKAIGLEFDGTGLGMGLRSKRYAMLVDDGVVKILNVEDTPKTADVTSAEALLAAL